MSKLAPQPIEDELAKEMLGEGFHTAFRKGVDSPNAHSMWQAIRDLPDEDWDAALEYVIWGLGEMGYRICQMDQR